MNADSRGLVSDLSNVLVIWLRVRKDTTELRAGTDAVQKLQNMRVLLKA
jgi:hypothetical protein